MLTTYHVPSSWWGWSRVSAAFLAQTQPLGSGCHIAGPQRTCVCLSAGWELFRGLTQGTHGNPSGWEPWSPSLSGRGLLLSRPWGQDPGGLCAFDLKGKLVSGVPSASIPPTVSGETCRRFLLFTFRSLLTKWILNESWGLCETPRAKSGMSTFSEMC